MTPSATSPNIAIIGAGPGGLTLARVLQLNDIPCQLYDADSHRHSRNQGGTLDLHPSAGQLALKEAGLLDIFNEHSRPEGECMRLLDSKGGVLWDENVTGLVRPVDASNRPEIDRTTLRDILLDSLRPNTVRWNAKISSVEAEPGAGGKHKIHLADGATESGIDLVIGADGAWSKARPLVTDIKPMYSGVTIIELWKTQCDTLNPWLSKHIGAGSCFMFDQDRVVMAQRQSQGAIRVYVGLRKPIEWSKECGIDWDDHAAARKQLAHEYFGDCGEDIKRSIIESDDHLVLRHAFMMPIGAKWEAKEGVTLLGDAAHLMTPFAGVGVNAAMADALDLANALIACKDKIIAGGESRKTAIAEAIRQYEATMLPRAKKYAQKTWDGLEHHFRATGGQEWAERARKHTEAVGTARGQ